MSPQCREIMAGAAEFREAAGPDNPLERVWLPSALWPAAEEAAQYLPGVQFVHDPEIEGMVFVARDPASVC